MRLFESWWERVPTCARVAAVVLSLVTLVLGGSADHYWDLAR